MWLDNFIEKSKAFCDLSALERVELTWWVVERLESLREFKSIATKHNQRMNNKDSSFNDLRTPPELPRYKYKQSCKLDISDRYTKESDQHNGFLC